MKNEAFESAVSKFHDLSTEQKAGAFSYLTGALESIFDKDQQSVKLETIANAYFNAVRHAQEFYPKKA